MPLVRAGAPTSEPDVSATRAHARKIRPELTRGPLVRVAAAGNQAEAELIQNILLEEGVPSVTRRTAGFDVPDFLAAGPRDVLVPSSGAETALTTLSALDIETPSHSPAAPLNRAQVARLLVALIGAATIAALIAWALVQLAG